MTLRLVSWNADRLLKRVPRRILSDYGDVLGPQLQNEIAKPQFDWPRKTRRRNGQVVGTPRDIVDKGKFIDSQTEPAVNETEAGVEMMIGWTAPYAADIYRGSQGGGFISSRGFEVVGDQPGRDWITPALEAQPFGSYFVQRWNEIEGRGT